MSFLAPLWIALAGAASAVVVALHLITTQRPPAEPLPTARFVPTGDAHAAARASRPSDLLLLLLRVLALMLLGAAAARPVWTPKGSGTARVIVVDRSRSAGAAEMDSAKALRREGDVVVAFDSSARIVAGAGDSLGATPVVGATGSLSAALVVARRAGAVLAERADSVELVVVSPVTHDEIDAATAALTSSWPGRRRVIATAPAAPVFARVTMEGARADDPLAATLGLLPPPAKSTALVIVRRDAVTDADRAAAQSGAALVIWPRAMREGASARGVHAGGATFVAELAGEAIVGEGTVVARWSDGNAAAVERVTGTGCERTVRIGVPEQGDAALARAFVRFASRLVAPCIAAPRSTTDTAAVRMLRADGPAATAAALRDPTTQNAPAALWCAVLAALALLIEWLLRDRGAREVTT